MNSEKYIQGMMVRREVLGDAYVDKAINSVTDFTRPLQELVSRELLGRSLDTRCSS